MDQADLTEISEALWAGAKQAEISQTLCYKQTDACKKKPPPLPKDRKPGHPFRERGWKPEDDWIGPMGGKKGLEGEFEL